MRRLIAVSLVLLMLIISLKVSVDFHYCCGKLAQTKIIIGFGKAGCGMDEPENSCKTTHSSFSLNKKPCCENQLKQIQVDNFQFTVNIVQYNIEYVSSLKHDHVSNLQGFDNFNFQNYKIPPDITSVSLPIIGVFLI